jgi:hypothetical protein
MNPQQQAAGKPITELERKLAELPLLPSVVSEILALNPDADDDSDAPIRPQASL